MHLHASKAGLSHRGREGAALHIYPCGAQFTLIGWKTCCALEWKSNYCLFLLLLLILSVSFYKKVFKKSNNAAFLRENH